MSATAKRLGPMVLAVALVLSVVALPGGQTAAAEDRLFRVTVLHFGGGRSATAPVDGIGGIDRFVELAQREHARAEQLGGDVVIGLGDHFAAGPEFAAARAEPAHPLDALALSRVPADAYVVGDHDLRYGTATLGALVDGVVRGDERPTFVSANLDVGADSALAPLAADGRIASSTVITRWGRPIGVVGVTAPDAVTTGRVTVDADVVAHTQTEIDRLRGQGVDIVIVASHLASLGADRALVESLSGVDLALGGGGEDVLASPNDIVAPGDEALVAGSYPLLVTDRDGRAVPLAATSGRYRYLGRLVAWFDGAGEIVRLAPESGPLAVTAELAPQRFVQRRVVDEVRGRVAAQPVEPLAISQVELDGVRVLMRTAESNFGDLVADAVLEAGRTGADEVDAAPPTVALVGSGGLGNDRVVPPGPFTVRDSFDMAGPELVMVSPPLSPDRLRRVLEYAVARGEDVAPRWVQVAGLSIEVDLTKRPLELDADGRVIQGGRRIRSVTLADGDRIVVDGQVVGDTDVVVAFDQSLVRGGHPLGDLSDAVVVGATVQQALAEHLTTRLEGAIGSRQYPEGGQGRIVRPGIPPRP